MVAALGRAGVLAQEKSLTERNIRSLLRSGCEHGHQPACDGLLELEARIAAASAASPPAAADAAGSAAQAPPAAAAEGN